MKKQTRRNKASSKKAWNSWFPEGFLCRPVGHLELKQLNRKILSEFQLRFPSIMTISINFPIHVTCKLTTAPHATMFTITVPLSRSWSSWKWCQNPSLRSPGISWDVLWNEILNHNALSRLLQYSRDYGILTGRCIFCCVFLCVTLRASLFPRWNKLRNQSYHFDLTPAL